MLAMRAKKNSKSTAVRNARIVEKDLNPYIGDRPIKEISARNCWPYCARWKSVAL